MIRNRLFLSLGATLVAGISTTMPAKALTFNFIAVEGTSTETIDAFKLAGDRWSSIIKDDITLNIAIGQQKIEDGSLGYANPTTGTVKTTDFLSQLKQDATSTYDSVAAATMPISNEGSISRLISHTTDNGGATHFDTSATNIWLTSANAKALGLLAGNDNGIDAEIAINSDIAWDYDGDSQVATDNYDLITTITHELGHALGIVSSVDLLDYNNFDDLNLTPSRGGTRDTAVRFRLTPSRGGTRDTAVRFRILSEAESTTNETTAIFSDADFNFVSGFDLFRYSATSASVGAIDMTLSTEDKYFSINGGVDALLALAKGGSIDGTQASHAMADVDSIMNPLLDKGLTKTITAIDSTILDVMGWDFEGLSGTNYRLASGNFVLDKAGNEIDFNAEARTPEPSSAIALLGLGLLTTNSIRKRHS